MGWHAAIASRPLQWGLLEQPFTHAMCIPPRAKEQGRKFFLRVRFKILDIARVHCQGAWFGALCDSHVVLESRIDRLDIAFPQLWHSVNPREWTPSETFVSLAADLSSQAALLRKFASCAIAGNCPFVDVHN